MLDNALEQSFTELASRGTGVEPEDVVQQRSQPSREPAEPPARSPRSQPSRDSQRDNRGRFVARADDDDESVDAYDVLEAEDPQTDQPRRRRTQRASEPAEIDDSDEYDEYEDEDDDPADARRRSGADEAELEDDDELELEGDLESEDEGYDDETERSGAQGGEDDRSRRREKRPSKKLQRWLNREVERRVGQVVEQNEALRAEQTKRDQAAAQGVQFLIQAIGTPDQHKKLENIAFDTRRPQAERDRAARTLATYRSNKDFALQYREGLLADIRANQAKDDQAVIQATRELRALDPKVIAKGDRAETLAHAYATGRTFGQQEAAKEISRLKRLLANSRGIREEQRVTRRMGDRSAGVARANGRRANGRLARPDPLRNVLAKERGIGNGSTFTGPTDSVLDQLKNGDITLADLGLGRVTL